MQTAPQSLMTDLVPRVSPILPMMSADTMPPITCAAVKTPTLISGKCRLESP
jgi:hypothetical protein